MIIFNAHRPYIHGFSSKKGLFLMLTLSFIVCGLDTLDFPGIIVVL